jgi:protoporphyrinogen oxidase
LKTAIIVGAGPAGLTAAMELLQRSDVRPIVFEADSQVGGISKTINYRGNRMDLGGHRFFSKSDWVMNWWQNLLPIAASDRGGRDLELTYQGKQTNVRVEPNGNADPDGVMLVRSRLSRIFYRRRFFDYPLRLNAATLGNLGPGYVAQIGTSYMRARLAPRSPESTLEDFLVNRFGDRLYRTFFKDYTEKVWGVPCSEISAEWGAQRIKGLSITKALVNALAKPFRSAADTEQKNTETSLIERFLYPKFGPGQMWEVAASRVSQAGGQVNLRHEVIGLHLNGGHVDAADVRDLQTGEVRREPCNFLLSTMPVKRLAELLRPKDSEVLRIATALPYRDFMTAGLLVRRMRPSSGVTTANGMPPDNWIYVQEPDVKLGRLQIFNNWSPYLVADPHTIWLGLEYFCAEGDALWAMRDSAFLEFASRELEKIGLIDRQDVMDGTVVRVPKAYPAYFGEYRDIGKVRAFLDSCPNVFPIGRNGMHRYNNQDHSMLAARAAVDCIVEGHSDKSRIWSVNAEEEYHEVATREATATTAPTAAPAA